MNTGIVLNIFIFSFFCLEQDKSTREKSPDVVPATKKCHQQAQTSKAWPCCSYHSAVLLIGWIRLAPETAVARAGMPNGLCDSSSFGSAEKKFHTSPSVQHSKHKNYKTNRWTASPIHLGDKFWTAHFLKHPSFDEDTLVCHTYKETV